MKIFKILILVRAFTYFFFGCFAMAMEKAEFKESDNFISEFASQKTRQKINFNQMFNVDKANEIKRLIEKNIPVNLTIKSYSGDDKIKIYNQTLSYHGRWDEKFLLTNLIKIGNNFGYTYINHILSLEEVNSDSSSLKTIISDKQNSGSVNVVDNLSNSPLLLTYRPEELQQAVDQRFEQVKASESWSGYIGRKQGSYNILGFDDKKLIIRTIADHASSNRLFIMDVGSGEGGWGKGIFEFIKNSFLSSLYGFGKIKFDIVIVSLSGDRSRGNDNKYYVKLGGQRLYYMHFDQFNIDNLIQELKNCRLNLEKQVNIIFSHKTLCHLVDPLWVLEQMYELLIFRTGLIVADGGFIYLSEDKDEKNREVFIFGAMDERWASALMSSNAEVVFYSPCYLVKRIVPLHFIMRRPDERGLHIKLSYADPAIIKAYQQISGNTTQNYALYQKNNSFESSMPPTLFSYQDADYSGSSFSNKLSEYLKTLLSNK